LINPIRFEDLISGVAYVSRFSSPGAPLSVSAVGTTLDGHLRKALEQRGHVVEATNLLAEASLKVSSPSEATGARSPASYNSASGKSKIAIVGMSGRFPEAEDPEAFWNLLFHGLDVHKVVPPSRWNAATHVDPTGKRKNTSGTPYGCWLNNPGLFDAKFFNVTPREAPQIDPASRLALMTAYEAMEQAGMVPGTTPSTQKDRVGVAYGVTSNDWMEVNSAQNIDTFFIPGGCRAFIPGRVNYFFKFSGPSFSQDTACSSSLSALHNACNMLWQGDVDTAVVGGTNILTNPDYTAGLDRGHFLSRTGNCKSFDQTADGYCRGEGCCTLILKRLDDALAEKDPILAVILGAYTNHSAEADSITRPLADAQKQIFTKILNDASVDPLDVSYVEMHGTGTQAGDTTEMESVVDTFAPRSGSLLRGADKPLYVGTVKSNVGHGEAAAGVTSLAKVLMMMKHNTIPPHAGLRTERNRNFPKDMDERNVRIALEPVEWRGNGRPRRAFVNNFSAAGGNSALLIEDAPKLPAVEGTDPRSTHIVTVSAKTPASLKGNIESLIAFLDQNSHSQDLILPTLSYTTTARRAHYPHRVAVQGSDLQHIKAGLRKALEHGNGVTRCRGAPPITFAFTGNGSQYIGMGKQLLEHFPSFRADMHRFDQMLQRQGFSSVMPLICASAGVGGRIDSFDAVTVQVATVCLELALARLWMSWGVRPASVVGHSLGEYAALAVAGVLSESDAIFLVARRAQLLQERCKPNSHAMLAVRDSRDVLDRCLSGRPREIACVNGPKHIVLAGAVDKLRRTKDQLQSQGVRTVMLAVPYAFHSAQMDPILDEFEAACQGVMFHKSAIPVICPLTATTVAVGEAGPFSPQYLRRHCREPVNFLGALQHAHSVGVMNDRSVVLEIGPQPIICGMVRDIFGTERSITTLASLKEGQDAFSLLPQSLSSLYVLGCDVNWREYHSAFPASHRVVQLPAYQWDLKDYWIQYVHDWSLRKGDPVPDSLKAPITFSPSEPSASSTIKVPPRPAVLVPKLESTSIHRVCHDGSVDDRTISIVVETDLNREDIKPLVQGHRVNNIPLATPSVYAEIALRVGTHIIDKYAPRLKGCVIGVEDLTIESALVAPRIPQQKVLRCSIEFNMESCAATCRFATLDSRTQKPQQHSHCKLVFRERTAALGDVQGQIEAAKSRIEALNKEVSVGRAFRFSKAMVYKMVGSLAQFDPDFRQLDEVVLNSDAMDASSLVSFASLTSRPGTTFHTNPAAIDAIGQSAGFVMNGNERADLEREVFVNHGWQSFQLFEPLAKDKKYRTYCKMEEKPAKRWEGDCLVLDCEEDRVVAWFGGINLQGVPRRVLHYILSNAYGHATPESSPNGAPKATQHGKPQKAQLTSPATSAPVTSTSSTLPAPDALQGAASASEQETTFSLVKPMAELPKARPKLRSGGSRKVQTLLQILSEETGIPRTELTESAEFADLGIDSLLWLQIASRLTEELEITVEFTKFSQILTVKGLCELIDPDGYDADDSDATPDVSAPEERSMVMNGPTMPAQVSGDIAQTQRLVEDSVLSTQQVQEPVSLPSYPVHESVSDNDSVVTKALQVISEESGIPVDELTDDVMFADLGVDSLLSLMITARFREELDIEVPSGASWFSEILSLRDLKRFLGFSTGPVASDPAPTPSTVSSISSSASSSFFESEAGESISSTPTTPGSFLSAAVLEPEPERKPEPSTTRRPARPASSVILSGRPHTDPNTLILFPDGSGCAISYAAMAPFVRPGLAIVGLNCPYLRHPEEMTPQNVSLDALMESYLTEIRRRQPSGPYLLGGWSSGGILAFRAAQMLIQQGEQVDHLVLIDAPPPTGLDPLPARWYEHCSKANIFGSMPGSASSAKSEPPATLVPHFRAQVEMLRDYVADPLPEGFTPKTSIVWAGRCVFDGRPGRPVFETRPEDPEGIKFLTEPRRDWSAGRWRDLFPLDEPEVFVMDGEDHFSMMVCGERLGKIVSDACS
jgi:iterative type I PKS product template protein